MNELQDYNHEQRNAFFLLKELMETILIGVYKRGDTYTVQKIERLRSELRELTMNLSSIDNEFWQTIWELCYLNAKEQFERDEMIQVTSSEISWQLVMDSNFSDD